MKSISNPMIFLAAAFCAALSFSVSPAFSAETASEKVSEAGRDMNTGAKKMGRDVKDKTCHLVKGEMQCAGEKIMHKTNNAVDSMKDKAEDIKK